MTEAGRAEIVQRLLSKALGEASREAVAFAAEMPVETYADAIASTEKLIALTCDGLKLRVSFNKRLSRALGRVTFASRNGVVVPLQVEYAPLLMQLSVATRRDTVAHEVAHVAAFHTTGSDDGHGPIWRGFARMLGAAPVPSLRSSQADPETRAVLLAVAAAKPKLTISCSCRTYTVPTRQAKNALQPNKRCTRCKSAFKQGP
jgi:predicted SprT family Zn-dependent metalloprotease